MDILLLYYLLISGATIALGSILGRILLRPLTWHRATRIYYIALLLSAWLLPLIGIFIPYIDWAELLHPTSNKGVALPQLALALSPTATDENTPLWLLLLPLVLDALWLLGTLFMGYRFTRDTLQLARLKKKCRPLKLSNGKEIYLLPSGHNAFSAFGTIYLPQARQGSAAWEIMYAHEAQHTQGKHHLDLLATELSLLVGWWNPFLWLLRRDLSLNLEHLADEGVLSQGFAPKAYQYELLHTTAATPPSILYSAYNNTNNLKERIKMMNKQTSPKRTLQRLWIVLPIAVLTLLGGNYLLANPMAQSFPQLERTTDQDSVYDVVTVMPTFPGGMEQMMFWLSKNLTYPSTKETVSGKVIVSFIVEKDGSISTVKIAKGLHPAFDAEALRVVRAMPNWTPGENNGKKVRVSFMLPILFKMESNSTGTSAPSKEASATAAQPKYLYVVNGKVLDNPDLLPKDNIAEMRVDKSQKKVTLEGKTYDLEALGLQGVIYITTK